MTHFNENHFESGILEFFKRTNWFNFKCLEVNDNEIILHLALYIVCVSHYTVHPGIECSKLLKRL